MVEEAVTEEAIRLRDNVSELTEQTFKMYSGRRESITIQFSNSLIGVVYDKFGEDTHMVRISEGKCVASVDVQVSPTFWGWIFQFVGEMGIISPESLANDYKARCEEVINEKHPDLEK